MNFRMTTAWLLTWGTVAVTLLVLPAGCDQGSYLAVTCTGVMIPANGCPSSEGDPECDDSCNCAAGYTCTNGAWSLAVTCPNFAPDASSCQQEEAPDAAHPGSEDAGVCPSLDLPAGASANAGTGCIDLEDGDCAVGEVVCSATPCLELGCQSLFYCLDGSWYPWGECTDDGGVVPTK
jgi:hypothetical protein